MPEYLPEGLVWNTLYDQNGNARMHFWRRRDDGTLEIRYARWWTLAAIV